MKSSTYKEMVREAVVAPYMGAWIEIRISIPILFFWVSHPTWVRGLKSLTPVTSPNWIVSHPTWVRGLKLIMVLKVVMILLVAPYMGAWIEIGKDL